MKTMKYFRLALLIFGVIAFQGCDEDNDCIPATGDVIQEELLLEPFTKVSLEISADVFIRQGDEQQVMVEAQSSIVDLLLQTSVANDDWTIRLDECVNTNEGINIFITIPALDDVSISGSGNVVMEDRFTQNSVSLRTSGSGSIDGDFTTTNLECSISGSGGIMLAGSAQTADIGISGSGSVEAFEMSSYQCDVSISGSGSVNVSVTELLEVTIAGSGSVRYKGNPTIDSSISGSGRVIDAN